MRPFRWASLSLLLLATVFSIGLAWAALEVPRAVSDRLIRTVDLPSYDSAIHAEETRAFLRSHGIRWVGYTSLAVVLGLILASVPFLAFGWPPRTGLYGFPYNVWPLAV